MVKGSFDVDEDGACSISEEQEPINFTDNYSGALNTTSLRHPSEFVPYKPGTDLILNVTAHSVSRSGVSWLSGVRLVDDTGLRVEKIVRVMGPRKWWPKWKRELTSEEKRNWRDYKRFFAGWELSEPQPVSSVPIRYELAYGGVMAKGLDVNGQPIHDAYQFNPVGIGWIDPEWTDHTEPVAAPQIEIADQPIAVPGQHYAPAGLGPVPPAWLPRRTLGGTYDKNWMDNVWPKWPTDYDLKFHNSAAAGLTITPHIKGSFSLHLLRLHETKEHFAINYEDQFVYISMQAAGGEWRHQRILADTVHLSEDLRRLFIVWRCPFNIATTDELQIHHGRRTVPEHFEILRQHMSTAPSPEEVAV